MMANQSRPFTAKPRIERTSQMISSVIISPIPEAYATPGADGAVGDLAARLFEYRSAREYVNALKTTETAISRTGGDAARHCQQARTAEFLDVGDA